MKPLSRLVTLTLLAASLARPAAAQEKNQRHPYQWYWGGQAGLFLYRTNAQKYAFDPIIGAHWMITRQRGALYIGVEEAFFTSDATANVTDANTGLYGPANFSKVRRIFAGLIAYPMPKRIEPFFGLGLALNSIVDANVENDATDRANAFILGGLQINVGNLAVFGQYVVNSNPGNFMLINEQHTVQGGVRYALGSSREEIGSSH